MGGGEEEEGGKQGATERKKSEGSGTPQGHGLFQEQDDDDGLPVGSPAKSKPVCLMTSSQEQDEKGGRSRCECF
jgi:hypothetical protein